jgi:uncharacterized protein YndB with AHSA1/START domain
MQFQHTVYIQASPDQVFDYILREEKQRKWMQEWAGVSYPNGINYEQPVGTRFVQKLYEGPRVGTYQGKITAYEPDRQFAVQLWSSQLVIDVQYQLTAARAGTRLHFRCNARFKGLSAGLKDFVASGYLKKTFQENLDRLKQLVEGVPTAGQPRTPAA